jgi:ABC-type thiamine transport system ATPase subunit/GNAT superfamily N-acetyltransferase
MSTPIERIINRQIPIVRSPRVKQVEGIFDLSVASVSQESWHVHLELPETWGIGLIVGPSGSGKTTIAHELFGYSEEPYVWPEDRSILDGFPPDMPIRAVVDLLSSVGFSSPPSWLRPYAVLSNGEKFRVDVARSLSSSDSLVVIDEFTSVVDRTVAQVGSAAVSKSVRKQAKQFIAVSCHYDIIDWLDPDWIYQPHLDQLERRSQRRRPPIKLDIVRVHTSAWDMFRKHHYLDTTLHKSARCFMALWDGRPVAFSAWLPSPGHKDSWREHRTVCLPDYQGVGIGNALSDYCASVVKTVGRKAMSSTSHPAMIRSRAKSPNWHMHRPPSMTKPGGKLYNATGLQAHAATTRLSAGFYYVGPTIDSSLAERLWETHPS